MPAIRRVIEYSGQSYAEVMQLPYDVFLLMLKHAVVDEYRSTPEGRQYLADCERLEAEVSRLRAQALREKQLARQVELNLTLKRVQAELAAARRQL